MRRSNQVPETHRTQKFLLQLLRLPPVISMKDKIGLGGKRPANRQSLSPACIFGTRAMPAASVFQRYIHNQRPSVMLIQTMAAANVHCLRAKKAPRKRYESFLGSYCPFSFFSDSIVFNRPRVSA